MDLPTLPLKAATATGLVHELVIYEIPGLLFVCVWAANPESYARSLLETPLLGYTTKVSLLALLAFVAGLGLYAVGEVLVGLITRGMVLLGSLVSGLKPLFRTPKLEREFIIRAFNKLNKATAPAVLDPALEPGERRWHSIVLTLLIHYTTKFRDLDERLRRRQRIAAVFSATATVLLLVGLLRLVPDINAVLALGLVALGLAVQQRWQVVRLAARLIVAGYFRETCEEAAAS